MPKTFLKILLLTAVMAIAGFSAAHAATNTTLDFDGDDYVVVGDNAVLDQANRLSLSVWIEPDDTPGGDEYILYRYNNYYLKINSSRKIVGGLNDSTERITSTTAITCDGAAWTHIEMTYDKDAGGTNEIKLYINGVLDATADYSTAISASDKKLYIGAGDTAGDNTPENWFDGQIDSVQLYQYARSADNVRLDYNEGLATHLGPVLKNCDDDPASCMDYGLVGYWNMDEGTGTTAYDSSDNSNDGTLTNGPKWTTDSPPLQGGAGGGSSLQFDGVDDYVGCGNDKSLNITDAITIEAWVKSNSISSYQHIVDKGGGNESAYQISLFSSKMYGWIKTQDGVRHSYKGSAVLESEKWYHLVATYDGSTLKYYVNSNKDFDSGSDFSGKIYVNNMNLLIGVEGGYGVLFNGSIDEVRIYNRALSAEEVRYHYNRGGPVAEWNFDEGSGQMAYDESFNNNDGTLGATSAVEASDPTWVEGKYGGALSFDGGDYVSSSIGAGTITNKITISTWVKFSGLGNQQNYIYVGNENEADRYVSYKSIDTNELRFWSNGFDLGSGVTVIQDTWYHVVNVFDGSIVYIYVDGNLKNSIADSWSGLPNVAQVTYAGTDGPKLQYYFNGSIDSVRIYNRALSAEEVLKEYNRGKATYFK